MVSLLPSLNQPARSHPTDRGLLHLHLSTLARVPLQICIIQPASLSPTNRDQDLLIGTLVQTLLLSSTSPPASLIRTGIDLQHLNFPVPTLLPIDINLLASITANLMSTKQLQPTPAPLHFISRERIVFLVSVPAQTDFFDRPPVDLYAEEGELSDDPDALEALHQLIDKNSVELVQQQKSLGFFNQLFFVPKPNNKWRPILDLSKLNLFLKAEKFKMETPETIRTSLQQGQCITSIDFKDAYFHIPIQEQSRKYLRFHVQGQTYQFKALPFSLSTAPLKFTVIAKEVKLMAIHKGIRIHQYLDDWLVRATSHQVCLQHTQDLVKICQELGWLVNLEKSELEDKQIFDFVGYQFDLRTSQVRPTPDWWQNLQDKILEILSLPACLVQQFMSLIGLLTATEKQVHLGRLHMRPIQWHLKNNWRVPESLEKVIPIPRSLQSHLQWWLKEDNVLTGQPLHPLKHALQIFTDASKEGWGTHLNKHTARGPWSLPESKLHINYLELKAVFLALKEFQDLCTDKIVLVATDNTTVVSYINKEGGMQSGPLCALLWRILTQCTRDQVTLKARHIPGRLNV